MSEILVCGLCKRRVALATARHNKYRLETKCDAPCTSSDRMITSAVNVQTHSLTEPASPCLRRNQSFALTGYGNSTGTKARCMPEASWSSLRPASTTAALSDLTVIAACCSYDSMVT